MCVRLAKVVAGSSHKGEQEMRVLVTSLLLGLVSVSAAVAEEALVWQPDWSIDNSGLYSLHFRIDRTAERRDDKSRRFYVVCTLGGSADTTGAN